MVFKRKMRKGSFLRPSYELRAAFLATFLEPSYDLPTDVSPTFLEAFLRVFLRASNSLLEALPTTFQMLFLRVSVSFLRKKKKKPSYGLPTGFLPSSEELSASFLGGFLASF